MKSSLRFISFLLLISLTACSSSDQKSKPDQVVKYDDDYPLLPGKVKIKVIQMRNEYGKKCVKPLLTQDFGASNCSNRLFQIVERRHGLNFTDIDLTRVAMSQFEPVLKTELKKLLEQEPFIKSEVVRDFKSPKNLLRIIKLRYLSGSAPFHGDMEIEKLAE